MSCDSELCKVYSSVTVVLSEQKNAAGTATVGYAKIIFTGQGPNPLPEPTIQDLLDAIAKKALRKANLKPCLSEDCRCHVGTDAKDETKKVEAAPARARINVDYEVVGVFDLVYTFKRGKCEDDLTKAD
jgi:hypothetical protein